MANRYIDATADTARPGALSVTTPAILTGVTCTDATPAVFTKTAHGLVDGDVVSCSGFSEATNLNGEEYAVNQVDANTFQLAGEGGGILGATEITAAETTGGTVEQIDIQTPTGDVRVWYDSTTPKNRLVDALQRVKERLAEGTT